MTYSLPAYLQTIYSEVHYWLDSMDDTDGFRDAKFDLDADDIKGLSRQFHSLFAAHYFKAVSMLNETITHQVLETWIHDNGRLCVIDVGCGAGAGSVAFIEAIRQVIVEYNIKHLVHIHIIGVDPQRPALELYRTILDRVKNNTEISPQIRVTHEFICNTILEGTIELQGKLQALRSDWSQPYIPHTVLLQVNVVRPLANQISDVAKAYHQIFSSTPMDQIHSLTIGTRGWENEVKQMQEHLEQHFHNHQISSRSTFDISSDVINPIDSQARNSGRETYTMTYHLTFSTIQSDTWQNDDIWLKIIDPDNITLAWARVRTAMLRESLIDEAEIRLFDHDVRSYISRLQRRLIAYAEDIAHPKDQVNYEIPKNESSFRPKSLSRFEEEILSVAIIQVAGREYSARTHLYAFRLNNSENSKSEFLYEFWGDAFDRYISDALVAVQSHPNGMVIRTDLSSYYTKISQQILIDTLKAEMRVDSPRVHWLLDRILNKDLHPNYHEKGFGLAQGGIGSGYYANIYLTEVDDYFTLGNTWNAKYFRYADDMVIVVPEESEVEQVLKKLDDILSKLKQNRSVPKTEVVSCKDFSLEPGLSPELKGLRLEYNITMKSIWVMGCHYHQQREIGTDSLYDFLDDYNHRLRALGLVIPVSMLRRKLIRYLSLPLAKRKLRFKITLPEFGEQANEQNWASSFTQENLAWIYQLDSLRKHLEEIVSEIVTSSQGNYNNISREDNRRLRFAVSRLCQIGMSDSVLELLGNILKFAPDQLREPAYVLDSLAILGHDGLIYELYVHYCNLEENHSYMRAMLLRAMRHGITVSNRVLFSVGLDSQKPIEERLMATEALLARKVTEIDDQSWAEINNSLSNEILKTRLRKNLVLLMREISDRYPKSFEPSIHDDPILFDAFNVKEGYSIFTLYEPEILMDYFDYDYPDDAYEYGELLTTISY